MAAAVTVVAMEATVGSSWCWARRAPRPLIRRRLCAIMRASAAGASLPAPARSERGEREKGARMGLKTVVLVLVLVVVTVAAINGSPSTHGLSFLRRLSASGAIGVR